MKIFNIEYKIRRTVRKLINETPSDHFNFIIEEARRQINAFKKKDYTEKMKQIKRNIEYNKYKWNKLKQNLEPYYEEEITIIEDKDFEDKLSSIPGNEIHEIKPIQEPQHTTSLTPPNPKINLIDPNAEEIPSQEEVKPLLTPSPTAMKTIKPILVITPKEIEEYENAVRLELEGKPLEKQLVIIDKSMKESIDNFQIEILNKISKELIDENKKEDLKPKIIKKAVPIKSAVEYIMQDEEEDLKDEKTNIHPS